MRFILKLILTAATFAFVLPMISGIDFHGSYGAAMLLAFFFGIILWLIDLLAVTISAMLTITSLGLALLVLIPLWLVGFWLLPVVALKLLAHFFPTYLTIHGWMPAIWGGLLLLFVGILTTNFSKLLVKNNSA